MNAIRTPKGTTPFEHRECGRCCGSGRYSWNAMHGSVCYGCQGRGWVLTKRGDAARQHYSALLSVPASSVPVGQVVRLQSITLRGDPYSAWYEVAAVEPRPATAGAPEMVAIQGTRMPSGAVEPDTTWDLGAPDRLVRVAATHEAKVAAQAKALAYQATLTQAGTVAKRPEAPRKPKAAPVPTLPPIAAPGAWDGPGGDV